MTDEQMNDMLDTIAKEVGISREQFERVREDDPLLEGQIATCRASFRRSGDRPAFVQGLQKIVSSASALHTSRYEQTCRQHGARGLGRVFAASGMTIGEAVARLKQAGNGAPLTRAKADHLAAQLTAENHWRGASW